MPAPRPLRHSNPQAVSAHYHHMDRERHRSIGLVPPPSSRMLATFDAAASGSRHAMDEAITVMCDERMADWLTQAFGPPDFVLEGKYVPAPSFAFDANGEMLLAICEPGSKGVGWVWLPAPTNTEWLNQNVSTNADAPALAHFWPDFVDGMMDALGHPLTRPELVFASTSLPMVRRRAEELEAVLAPSPPASRPLRL